MKKATKAMLIGMSLWLSIIPPTFILPDQFYLDPETLLLRTVMFAIFLFGIVLTAIAYTARLYQECKHNTVDKKGDVHNGAD